MNEVTLPASPNWYLSKILVCSTRGSVVWGTKNNIVISKQNNEDEALKFSIIKDAHLNRVTAIAFCPKIEPGSPELMISCGEDDKAKIWNMDTLELVMLFTFDDNKPLTAIDWSIKDTNLACAVNSQGYLLSCNIKHQTAKKVMLPKQASTCIACCPHESNLVAVGSKNGLIFIVNLKKKDPILYKLRGHDEEIISLSWCPSDKNVLSENKERDLLLASSAKDKSIYIWRAGRDGRYETIINLPKVPLTSQTQSQTHKSKLGAAAGIWTTLSWVTPNVLLTNSFWGELLSWNLSAESKKKHQCELIHAYHNRGLFCIATVPKYDEITNSNTRPGFTIWTLAQDRWIVCCYKEIDKPMELKYKIPTHGGYVYCIAACPIDTSRIAFGVGDHMFRVWNLSESHVTTFDITMYWQKIMGKIRAIAWEPENEFSLAFGTSEGRVGVYNLNNNCPILFRQYHRNTIYKLEWGKIPKQDNFGVFSCSEGELVLYDPKNPDANPMSIKRKECTEFSWKPDKSILAVGLESGTIILYDQHLEKFDYTIYVLKKSVNYLAWHPMYTAMEDSISPMKDYLAVASDSRTIIVYDFSKLTEIMSRKEADTSENKDSDRQEIHKVVATLNGHSNKVVCLAWSPHFNGHLVSASYDHVVQVWNIERQEVIGTYMGHNGPVLCCMWSPLKPQLIISGSSDNVLHVWDYTLLKQSPKQHPDVQQKKIKQKANKAQKNDTKDSDTCDNPMAKTSSEPSSQLAARLFEESERKPDVQSSKEKVKKKTKEIYFPTIKAEMSNGFTILDCIKHDIKMIQKEDSDLQDAKENCAWKMKSLFCEKDDLKLIVSKEKIAHAMKHKYNTMTEMDMWSNGFKHSLEWAVKENRLNDYLVSLSASLSVKTWKEMCEAYAQQLIAENDVGKAVSYLLCINKIYEAIRAFLDANMYKEAYVLARLRLDDDDTTIKLILTEWSKYTVASGQLEQAAQCYLKLGNLSDAATVLSRRNEPDSLEVASKLAFMDDKESLGKLLARQAITQALKKLNYSKAHSIIVNIPQLQNLTVLIDAHEAIMTSYKKETACDSMRKWIKERSGCGLLQTLNKKYDVSYYDNLKHTDISTDCSVCNNDAAMQLFASYNIALAATSDTKEIQLIHIATTLGNVFQHEVKSESTITCINMEFFIHILTILDDRLPTDEDSIYAETDYPVSTSIRAYLCTGLMNWLIHDMEQLSHEERSLFAKIVESLINSAFDKEFKEHVYRNNKIMELKQYINARYSVQEASESETLEDVKKSYGNLMREEQNFRDERVSAPDPQLVYNHAVELCKILRDTHEKQLLECLSDKCNLYVQNKNEGELTLDEQ